VVRAQIGNELGVASVDKTNENALATVTADGSNTFTVSVADARNLRIGMMIDVTHTSGSPVRIGNRSIDAIVGTTGVITYSGADGTVQAGDLVFLTGQYEPATPPVVNGQSRDDYANLNGGASIYQGTMHFAAGSIQAMRERLTAISGTTYSSAELDKMTYNDLVYALRVNDIGGIK
jgi:hypothetical protein